MRCRGKNIVSVNGWGKSTLSRMKNGMIIANNEKKALEIERKTVDEKNERSVEI
jgi:ABC-type antimicrobial peptide transport system ATPase subunit